MPNVTEGTNKPSKKRVDAHSTRFGAFAIMNFLCIKRQSSTWSTP